MCIKELMTVFYYLKPCYGKYEVTHIFGVRDAQGMPWTAKVFLEVTSSREVVVCAVEG